MSMGKIFCSVETLAFGSCTASAQQRFLEYCGRASAPVGNPARTTLIGRKTLSLDSVRIANSLVEENFVLKVLDLPTLDCDNAEQT
jgi:hypothetical protein